MKKMILSSALMLLLCSAWITEMDILVLPHHFPAPSYDFTRNTLSEPKIALGRALFYDPILSIDNTISCASCHSPYHAFAHTDHELSHGIDDQIGTRNAPALFNLAWHRSFMWDGAINHLDMQALAPITHAQEMGESIEQVIEKLENQALYRALFEAAYDNQDVTGERILKALSQFQLTLISAESKYDQVILNQAQFTEQEDNGYAIFQKHCNSCHQEPLFISYPFESNGLPIDSTLLDYGRWNITQDAKDRMLFKVPSLRNLSYTKPYMHDGRFDNLYEVVSHYADGIDENAVVTGTLVHDIVLDDREKVDLVSFLLTLNDRNFITNKAYHYPRAIFDK